MIEFRLKADCLFEAEDLDDALRRLSEHFRRTTEEEDYDEMLITQGSIHIEPADSEGDPKV